MEYTYEEFLKEYPGIHLLEPEYCMEYYNLWKTKMEQLEKLKDDATNI